MHSAPEPSIEDLRRRSELARADLSATVRELRSKVNDTTTDLQALLSPSRVKDEVKSYARKSGDDLYQRIEGRIRENPLQAAAVGMGLAYPVVSIFRRVPAPLMLISAGFWLAGQSGHKSQPNLRKRHLADEGDSALQPTGEVVRDAPSIVSDLGTDVQKNLERTASTASEKFDQAAAAAQERISVASERMTQTATAGADRARNAARQSQRSASDFVDRNPMLVAGIGIGLGAVIAALLPATRSERRVLGPIRENLQNEAETAAARGVNSLRSATDEKLQAFLESLKQEGLGADDLAQSAAALNERVKAVAERGLAAALGDATPERQPKSETGEGQ